jgi:hypothetical protein
LRLFAAIFLRVPSWFIFTALPLKFNLKIFFTRTIILTGMQEVCAMNVRKVLLLLLMGILITNLCLSQTNTNAKTKTEEKIDRLLKELEDSKEGPEQVDILINLSIAYKRISTREKPLALCQPGT